MDVTFKGAHFATVSMLLMLGHLPLAGCGRADSGTNTPINTDAPTSSPDLSPTPAAEASEDPPPGVDAEGIVVVAPLAEGQVFGSGSARIYTVDPESGATADVASFSATDPVTLTVGLHVGEPAPRMRSSFDDDFGRAAARLNFEKSNGSSELHAGWVDQSGEFTDASALVGDDSDFAESKKDLNPFFDPEGNFYFTRVQGGKFILYRYSEGDTAPQVYVERDDESDALEYVVPRKGEPFVTNLHDEYWFTESESCTPEVTEGRKFYAVASAADVCVGLGGSTGELDIWKPAATEANSSFGSGWGGVDKFSGLLPENGRFVAEPVVDPQGKRVAFLSSEDEGAETLDLFIVPTDGSKKITKVGGGVNIPAGDLLMGWVS